MAGGFIARAARGARFVSGTRHSRAAGRVRLSVKAQSVRDSNRRVVPRPEHGAAAAAAALTAALLSSAPLDVAAIATSAPAVANLATSAAIETDGNATSSRAAGLSQAVTHAPALLGDASPTLATKPSEEKMEGEALSPGLGEGFVGATVLGLAISRRRPEVDAAAAAALLGAAVLTGTLGRSRMGAERLAGAGAELIQAFAAASSAVASRLQPSIDDDEISRVDGLNEELRVAKDELTAATSYVAELEHAAEAAKAAETAALEGLKAMRARISEVVAASRSMQVEVKEADAALRYMTSQEASVRAAVISQLRTSANEAAGEGTEELKAHLARYDALLARVAALEGETELWLALEADGSVEVDPKMITQIDTEAAPFKEELNEMTSLLFDLADTVPGLVDRSTLAMHRDMQDLVTYAASCKLDVLAACKTDIDAQMTLQQEAHELSVALDEATTKVESLQRELQSARADRAAKSAAVYSTTKELEALRTEASRELGGDYATV